MATLIIKVAETGYFRDQLHFLYMATIIAIEGVRLLYTVVLTFSARTRSKNGGNTFWLVSQFDEGL